MDKQGSGATQTTSPRSVRPLSKAAAEVAEEILAAWGVSEDALCPIIGRGGVDALYTRSLLLTARAYPWMAQARGESRTADLDKLRAVLAQQDGAEAAAGGGALLETFHDLLASVIGASLRDRLLRSTWVEAVTRLRAREPSK